LVVALLRPWFPAVIAVPEESIVALGSFSIVVAPICSGLEGIGLVTVLTTGLLVTFRRDFRFPHALLLLPLGVAGVWVANGIRVALLLVIGAAWSPEVALGGFHSKAGWVFFCAIALALATVGRRSSFFARAPSGESFENPTAAFLVPALAIISVGLVTGMLAGGADRLYFLRIVVAGIALYRYRNAYRQLDRRWHFGSVVAGVAVGGVWLATAPPPVAEPEDVGLLWIVARVLGSVLIVPICEELAFRGYLLRRLISERFDAVPFTSWTPVALVGSSLGFALVHERWVLAFVTGLVFAMVQVRTGRLMDAIVAHGASNVMVCAWVLITGERWHW
jgi:exosortase E/protease (VPEID-CTERM system)